MTVPIDVFYEVCTVFGMAILLFIGSFCSRLHLTSCQSTSCVSHAALNSSDPFLCREGQSLYGRVVSLLLRWGFQPAQRTFVNRHMPLLSLKLGAKDVMPQAGIPRISTRVSECVYVVSRMCTFWKFYDIFLELMVLYVALSHLTTSPINM